MENEIWKEVPGYEGLYEVSSECRFRKVLGEKKVYFDPKPNKLGYRVVRLRKDGKLKTVTISHLAAEAFIPNPDNKPFVDHIVPLSNGGTDTLSNLRWVTPKENSNNQMSRDNMSKAKKGVPNVKLKGRKFPERSGANHHQYGKPIGENTRAALEKIWNAKERPWEKIAIVQMSISGDIIQIWDSSIDAEKELGLNHANIIACLKGRRKTAYGFKWKYA